MPFTFDTHAAVRDLVAAGFPTEQAEAIVGAIAKSDSALATKADLDAAIARLDGRIDGLEAKLDGLEAKLDGLEAKLDAAVADIHRRFADTASRDDIVRSEIRTLKWAMALGFAIATLLFAALRFT